MISLYVLDVEEFQPVIDIAAMPSSVTRGRTGHYATLRSSEAIVVDRRATGVRHAVWYSAIGALSGGRVVQHDKDAMRIEPT